MPSRPPFSRFPTHLWRNMFCLVLSLSTMLRADVLRQKATEEDSALPLPRWSEQEIQAFRDQLGSQSGILLPEAEHFNEEWLTQPIPLGPRLDQGSGKAPSEIPPSLRAEDMRLFLPESLLGSSARDTAPARILPTPVSALKDVTPEFLTAGAQALPNEYLIDPTGLVTEVHHQELTRFLEFHAHEAMIKLHVLVLGRDQKLPASVNLDAIGSGSLAKGTACLVVYPLGEPWRARLFLSKSVHDHASAEFMKETARACVGEALQNSEEHDQLRSFAVELSTRLFWLQKALGSRPPPPATRQPLAEISAEAPATAAALAGVPPPAPMVPAAALGGVMLLGLLARPLLRRWRQWRRLRLQNRVWLLPEVETVPRLGGAFSGGGGGMLSYGKNFTSPLPRSLNSL